MKVARTVGGNGDSTDSRQYSTALYDHRSEGEYGNTRPMIAGQRGVDLDFVPPHARNLW